MRDHLVERLPRLTPEQIDQMLAEGRFVDDTGQPLDARTAYLPHTFIWFHRDLPDEVEVPYEIEVLHRDEQIVVIDKPHFLSTIPRGQHIRQSVVVRARDQLGLPELAPAHRLDRITAGVLLLTTERRWRGPYQSVFEHRRATKVYEAIAPVDDRLTFPQVVRSHIVKERGVLQAHEIPGAEPNAETVIELLEQRNGLGRYRATPRTGKTHQIRLHMLRLGLPIINDPFYPELRDIPVDDFSAPLQLLARELAFTDPITGAERHFTSHRALSAWTDVG
ncbi:pseudouridine synthase [Propionibacteriaceae bacterium Y1700]|uniref:pseudouridine synthase n=1 Tax=Microlunatus sp. Y1700 TaxID=3418487 RepID=UPI003DA75B04